ncbi:MAG: hypothetical protein ACAI25_16455 [Planctomycetota bacterium]
MPDIAHCPRCDADQKYDLRGSCRSCGTKIAPNSTAPGPSLDIPRSWGELWPTLLLSGMILVAGVALIAAGVWCFRNIQVNGEKIGIVIGLFGGGLVVAAAKLWVK